MRKRRNFFKTNTSTLQVNKNYRAASFPIIIFLKVLSYYVYMLYMWLHQKQLYMTFSVSLPCGSFQPINVCAYLTGGSYAGARPDIALSSWRISVHASDIRPRRRWYTDAREGVALVRVATRGAGGRRYSRRPLVTGATFVLQRRKQYDVIIIGLARAARRAKMSYFARDGLLCMAPAIPRGTFINSDGFLLSAFVACASTTGVETQRRFALAISAVRQRMSRCAGTCRATTTIELVTGHRRHHHGWWTPVGDNLRFAQLRCTSHKLSFGAV